MYFSRHWLSRQSKETLAFAPGFQVSTSYLVLFDRGGNVAERGVQVRPERLHGGDDRNRDARGDEAIFDGRGARLVLHKTRKKLAHWMAPEADVVTTRDGFHTNKLESH
jgi:hypothetical protein